MRRLALGVLSLILLAACGGATAPSQPAASAAPLEKTSVKIAVGGQTQFIYLPLTLADQLGYFKEQGLTVEISDLRGGAEALSAVLGGSADVVTGFYEHTIRTQVQGKNLKMVVLFDLFPGLVLMVGKKHADQVRSIKDLVGHPVGVTAPGSSTDAMVKFLLKQNGLDPTSIPVVGIGASSTAIAAIEQDRVWAGVTVDPLASKMERDGTAKPLYDTRTGEGTKQVFGGPWPAGGFYTTADFIKQNPNTIQALVRAGVKALKYIASHSEADVASKMPASYLEIGRDLYLASLKANRPMFSPDGLMPADGPANVLKTLTLVDSKITPDKVNLKDTFDNSFAEKAK